MANRFDWNALEQNLASVLEQYDELNRTKALSVVASRELFDIDSEEAVDCLTDGGNDRGVDLFFIDDRDGKQDIHLLQVKCADTFENSKKNFPGSEVDKLLSFVNDLAGQDMDALATANPLLKAKIADASDTLKEANATITVHFISNTEPLVDGEKQRIETAFSRYRAISFEMHGLDALSDYFLEKRAPNLEREITAIDTNFFDRSDQNLRGVVCTVTGTDIVEMIRSQDDPNIVEESVFDQNVRVYLKRGNRINKTIIESALDENNHMFWYQNNGITMTCDKFVMGPSKRSPKISMTNVQIVNGGQTSNCLFEAWNEDADKVADLLLLVRIIETTDEDVKLSIAETTNSQTPINVRDLKSNDRLQRQLEASFADLGHYYERKKGQHAEQNRALRIDALDASQAYLAYGVGMPEISKKDRGRIFGDLYETVFSDEISAQKLLTSFYLMQAINEQKKELRRRIKEEDNLAPGEMALIDGAFHALFALRQICVRDDLDLWNFDIAKGKVGEATQLVQGLYAAQQASDDNFSSNRFFKDARTKDIITRIVG
ncbi:AIPR family protein [Erythrobacteraceae bacterium E2-1 Yellow Sea]|nr:AIPR family protein [Erythrobacteraceae bacterium E2-1 Yellow Sea]